MVEHEVELISGSGSEPCPLNCTHMADDPTLGSTGARPYCKLRAGGEWRGRGSRGWKGKEGEGRGGGTEGGRVRG